TLAAEHLDGVGGGLARAIGEGDDAKGAALPRDEHRGTARRRQRVKLRVNGGVAEPALLDQPVIADERGRPGDDSFGASSGYRLKGDRGRQCNSRLDSSGENSAAHRVLRSRFET